MATAAEIRHAAQANVCYIGQTVTVTVDAGVHVSDALPIEGRFMALCAETDVYIRQGGAGVTVTTGDMLLPAGTGFFFNTDDATNNKIAVLSASNGGGTLRITRVDSVS